MYRQLLAPPRGAPRRRKSSAKREARYRVQITDKNNDSEVALSAKYLMKNNTISPKWTKSANVCLQRCHPIPTLDYSHGWIPLFWFAEGYIRTNVTNHTIDEY